MVETPMVGLETPMGGVGGGGDPSGGVCWVVETPVLGWVVVETPMVGSVGWWRP